MHDDDEFLRSIPAFLRRYQEPPRRKLPIRPRDLPAAGSQTQRQSGPAPVATPTAKPAVTTTPATSAVAKVVEIAQPAAVETPVAQRARIALAFKNHDLAEGTAADDIAFQVTLPRGVVRQIRELAAEQDTSQHAVVLRALRLAGLSVPERSDIDCRGGGAKRQA